jgi:lipopolysaccharide transport system ATP-binding protein
MLTCENLCKKFKWYDRSDTLKASFTKIFKTPSEKYEWYVLDNINFRLNGNEKIGIIGKNGCGKSTLLKIISGIYLPTSGKVISSFKRTIALIELGVGFYPELTGLENIRLNWLFNGLPSDELKYKLDSIIEFSGVKDFLRTPLKYFSSGMVSRLGFSIAIHTEPELFIIDETLSVGDEEFQEKCFQKINEISKSGTAFLIVTHNLNDIAGICDKAIWLNDGKIAKEGKPDAVIGTYLDYCKHIDHNE